jgi:hypothetical protein
LRIAHYLSAAIEGGGAAANVEGGGECEPEPLDLSQSSVAASSEFRAAAHGASPPTVPSASHGITSCVPDVSMSDPTGTHIDYPAANAIDRDDATFWEMDVTADGAAGLRDPAVSNHAWFQVDLKYEVRNIILSSWPRSGANSSLL